MSRGDTGESNGYQGSGRDRFNDDDRARERAGAFSAIDREKLEILDGSRVRSGAALRKAAVRVNDLNGMIQMLDMPKNLIQSAYMAGGTPSTAEVDLIRTDLLSLHRQLLAINDALVSVSTALRKRLA
jgi:hypothetical protein